MLRTFRAARLGPQEMPIWWSGGLAIKDALCALLDGDALMYARVTWERPRLSTGALRGVAIVTAGVDGQATAEGVPRKIPIEPFKGGHLSLHLNACLGVRVFCRY